jgi:DNA replication protein DnaC
MAEALKAATEFASRSSVPWLVLAGHIGCGKTHLCYAVANRMTAEGVVVRFWNVAYLLDVIRSTYDQKQTDRNPRESVEDMVYTPTVLILDDLGAEKPSDWVAEKLFEVIDRRYSEGKGLMVTTNESLAKLSPRVQSRFKDKEMCRIVVTDSPDYRTKLGVK